MNAIMIVFGILAFVSLVLFFAVIIESKKIKSLKETMKTVIDANNNLHNEIAKLKSADEIKNNNRREANEKIDNLHNGNAIDNALNVLHNNGKK